MSKEQQAIAEPAIWSGPMIDADIADILTLCGGSLDPLRKAFSIGLVRGVAGIIGGGAQTDGAGGPLAVLAQELVKQDILVLVAGGATTALDEAGLLDASGLDQAGAGLADFCAHLDIAPALRLGGDADTTRFGQFCAALAEGMGVGCEALPVLVCTVRRYGDEGAAIGLYAPNECRAFLVQSDPFKAAEAIARHITAKRLALGFNDRYDGTVYS
jgi:carbon-monoxide dehydrogenase catalytic subunit